MKQRNVTVITCSLIAVFLVAVSVANANSIKQQLHDWKVLPQSEPLTELYFDTSKEISNVYTPGIVEEITFGVRNIEYRTISYNYVVTQIGQDGNSQLLASGSFRLHNNEYSTQKLKVTPSDLGRSQIQIKIEPTGESIHFWVNKA